MTAARTQQLEAEIRDAGFTVGSIRAMNADDAMRLAADLNRIAP